MFLARNGLSTPAASDPYIADVMALLHFDGDEDSTTFIDSSPLARTITPQNTARLTQTTKRFGSACGDFTTNNDHIVLGPLSDFGAGTYDWTAEFFVKPDSASTGDFRSVLMSNRVNFFGLAISTTKITVYYSGTYAIITQDVPTDAFSHIAITYTRSSTTLRVYFNGSIIGTYSADLNVGSSGYYMFLGSYGSSSSARFMGFIDEFRFTKNRVRAVAVPTEPYPDV